MRVALIGNMNNNHFSLMRYLVDFDIDAHLLLYNNEQKHFLPQNDTWEIDKWSDRIHTLRLDSYGKASLYLTKSQIRNDLSGYDIYIGNGFAPGYFSKIKKQLDLFLPYSNYVEGLNKHKSKNIIKSLIQRYLRRQQIKGLNSFTSFASALGSTTKEVLVQFNCEVLPLGIPMVYIEKPDRNRQSDTAEIIDQLLESETIIFSHVSHIWKNIPNWWSKAIKSNNILIEGFAKYRKQTKNNAKLVLLDYGPDVKHSKNLIKSLGINDSVIWLNKASRKEIMLFLDYVDIGCGELGGEIWGGTGWEFMSKGVPFFQSVDMPAEAYEKDTGTPFPLIINVNSPKAICEHLFKYEKSPKTYKDMGEELKVWFDEYGGVGLARKYRDLIYKLYKKKYTRD